MRKVQVEVKIYQRPLNGDFQRVESLSVMKVLKKPYPARLYVCVCADQDDIGSSHQHHSRSRELQESVVKAGWHTARHLLCGDVDRYGAN